MRPTFLFFPPLTSPSFECQCWHVYQFSASYPAPQRCKQSGERSVAARQLPSPYLPAVGRPWRPQIWSLDAMSRPWHALSPVPDRCQQAIVRLVDAGQHRHFAQVRQHAVSAAKAGEDHRIHALYGKSQCRWGQQTGHLLSHGTGYLACLLK